MPDLEKIIFNRSNNIVQNKDSIYNYQPLEYSIDELQQKNSSIFNLLSNKIDSNSHVLSSAYIGIPIKKLNLKFNQVRIIYGDISKSDILWLIKAQGSKNYILIKKDSPKKFFIFFKFIKIEKIFNKIYQVKTFLNISNFFLSFIYV